MKRLVATIVAALSLSACAAEPVVPAAPPPPVASITPGVYEYTPLPPRPDHTPMVLERMAQRMPSMPKAAHKTAKATAPANKGRQLVYLASYHSEDRARTGWAVLTKASPILAKQQPVLRPVDLGAKGHWVRLYATAADTGEQGRICSQVANKIDGCGARYRD